jgi:NADPH:quinone reductase-like Zn-dependent oxidoreductase
MLAWQISSFGVDSLEVVERPTPAPGPGEVLVAVHAISLNYRDLLVVKGKYNPKMKLPRIPCSDGAGEVMAVADGVTAWKPGDRVAGIFMQNWLDGPLTPVRARGALGGDVDGMLASHVVLKETGLVAIPEHLSYQEASTLPCAAVTAWNALATGDLKPGGFRSLRFSLRGSGACGFWASPAAARSWSAPAGWGWTRGSITTRTPIGNAGF